MTISTSTITQLAARATSILLDWANLNPLRKNDNGDTSAHGGLAMLLGALADKSKPVPSDAGARIYAYLVKVFTERAKDRGYLYMSFDVDYSPNSELRDLSAACGLNVSWPNKSGLNVQAGEDEPGYISNRQGCGARGINYSIVPELGGTLVTNGFHVPTQVRAVVAAAVIAGDPVGTWEAFAASA